MEDIKIPNSSSFILTVDLEHVGSPAKGYRARVISARGTWLNIAHDV